MGPKSSFSDQLHARKYRGPGENFREAMSRVANGLKDNDKHYHEFREILLDMRFLPAGRVQSAIGSTNNVTAFNCFVSGTIEDSFVHGGGSIMARAQEAAATLRMGGGIGFDFSTLRPRGELIKKLQSRATGPVSFMNIYNAVGLCTSSTDHRRGALMGVLRIDHPDIEEFVRAKQNETELRGFNISIAITDEFMEALAIGRPFPLKWGGQVYREVDPAALWDMVMRSTWDWAEPGVLFIDTINKQNNLSYCETISATNPCSEQTLPPFGACLLGSYCLPNYVTGFGARRSLDLDQLRQDIRPVVRAMDNVTDRSLYPLYEQEKEAKSKRRMGLGVTGLANALEALGLPYGSPTFVAKTEEVLALIRDETYRASVVLAREKGAFPLYDERYLAAPYIQNLPDELRDSIKRHGIRNSHLTSIAPTGTISLCADNVSSSIEPVFAYEQDRTVQGFSGPETTEVKDFGVLHFGVSGKRAGEVSVAEHLAVLAVAQKYVDSAVSKTLNVGEATGWEDFKAVYTGAYAQGCKGCTTYRVGGLRGGAPIVSRDVLEGSACEVDVVTGRRNCE